MKARIGSFLPGILLAAAGLGTTPSLAAAQSPLLSNGRGFSLTQLLLRQKSGTSWISVPAYINGQEYRLTVKLTNSFTTTISVGNPLASCHVGYLVDLRFVMTTPGATFSSVSGGAAPQVSISTNKVEIDDPPPLYNQQSRTYYVYFKWTGPNVAVPAWPHSINIRAGEVCTLPNMSPFPLFATF